MFLATAFSAISGVQASAQTAAQSKVLTGQAAFTDWNQQAPGVRHKLTLADLPEPR